MHENPVSVPVPYRRSNLYSAIFQLCAEAGFQPRIRYLGYDPDLAGMLLSVPNSVILSSDSIDLNIRQTGLGNDRVSSVPIRNTEGKSIIGVAVRVGHYQSEAALAFYDMVAEHFGALHNKVAASI